MEQPSSQTTPSPKVAQWLPEECAIAPSAGGVPACDFAAIPAKAAVYLLVDETGGPLLLATVGNLRAALERRLAEIPPEHKTKRIPYRDVCRYIRYRVVHSPFAANWVYARAAKEVFPETYRELITWRRAWWVAVDPDATFPKYTRTQDVDDPSCRYAGPLFDKTSAGKAIDLVIDLFDTCRYHHILVQAPHGRACAYKEMGKCPAPCDGSIPLEPYRGQVAAGADLLVRGYPAWRSAQEGLMRQAAAKLNFEIAGKIKAKLALATLLERPDYARMDAVERFNFLSLQPGKGRRWLEPFFIHGGEIVPGEPAEQKNFPKVIPGWIERLKAIAGGGVKLPLSREATETMGLVCHHLFRGPDDAGIYLPAHDILEGRLTAEGVEHAAVELLERRIPARPMAEQSSDAAANQVAAAEAAIEVQPAGGPAAVADAH